MTDGEFFDIDPMVTPDGKWIYFSSDRLGRMNIWRMQTQGRGGLTKITDSPSVAADMEVCVSPKGDKIAYTSLLAGANVYQVWFANADGTLPTQIRAGKNPAWSPDGKRVAYVAPDPVSKKDKIWVMDADGANPTQMTRGTESDDRYPVWTPDGSRIIYASNRGLNEDQEPNFDIWMMNEDGTGQTQLTINGSYDSRPAISRDGRYIYFISNRGAQRENQETLQIWRIEL
jgi:TolB protein